MAMRDAGAQSFAPRGAPAQPRHVGGGPRLVDEHQPFGIEIGLTVEPGLAPLYDVRTIPLRGVGGLLPVGPVAGGAHAAFSEKPRQ